LWDAEIYGNTSSSYRGGVALWHDPASSGPPPKFEKRPAYAGVIYGADAGEKTNCGRGRFSLLTRGAFRRIIGSMFDVKDIDLYDLEDDDFDTIIWPDVVFQGSMRFSKPLMIRGVVCGTIAAQSDLVIDEKASVFSDVTADRVLVRGLVEGNITAKRIVIVTSAGSVTGNISSAQVVLEPGAIFSGNCTMTRE
jgi:cytoskeletal protein CcmA (bactofilin family)